VDPLYEKCKFPGPLLLFSVLLSVLLVLLPFLLSAASEIAAFVVNRGTNSFEELLLPGTALNPSRALVHDVVLETCLLLAGARLKYNGHAGVHQCFEGAFPRGISKDGGQDGISFPVDAYLRPSTL